MTIENSDGRIAEAVKSNTTKEKSEDSGDEFFAVSYKGAACGWHYLFTGNAREFICFVGGFELSLRNKDLCIFLRHYRN